MASDRVVCQRRTVFICVYDLAVRHETELDQRLEAVAYAADQSVSVVKQVCDRILDLFVSEESSDELRRSIRLISSGETAGYEYHLRFFEFAREVLNRFPDIF